MSMAKTMWVTAEPERTAPEAKSVPVVGSITMVEVMPTVGPMSPHGSMAGRTGVPKWRDHATVPFVADRAYTVSFSVATNTCPP